MKPRRYPVSTIERIVKSANEFIKTRIHAGYDNMKKFSDIWNNYTIEEKRLRGLFSILRFGHIEMKPLEADLIVNQIQVSKNRYAFAISLDFVPSLGIIVYVDENEGYFLNPDKKNQYIPKAYFPIIIDYIEKTVVKENIRLQERSAS